MLLLSQEAPLKITAITLRGIGSYLRGARLEIKPLTILCGENGSGKSTWLKALNLLRRSLTSGHFPYSFGVDDDDEQNLQVTNAFFRLAPYEEIEKFLNSVPEDDYYGPPGTIGIDMEAMRDFRSSESVLFAPPPRELEELFWPAVRKGTRISIRIAHPSHRVESLVTPRLFDFMELRLNERDVVQIQGERDAHQKFVSGKPWPIRTKPYRLMCSKCFLSEDSTDPRVVELASFDFITNTGMFLDTEHSFSNPTDLLRVVENVLKNILTCALDGFFYLDAIRRPHLSTAVLDPSLPHSPSDSQTRHVGKSGEYTWQRENEYELNLMRPDSELVFQGNELWLQNWFGPSEDLPPDNDFCNSQSKRWQRVWAHADEIHKSTLARIINGDERNRLFSVLADLCNSVLDNPDLYDPNVFENTAMQGEVTTSILSSQDLRRLNYELIRSALAEVKVDLRRAERCYLGGYISSWLRKMVNVWIDYNSYGIPKITTPFLIDPGSPEGDHTDRSWGISKLGSDSFGIYQQHPQQFSAAFHQVFPIVVQLGLMRAHETLGVENPEVHCHPSLQMRLTEMLLHHAISGRQIIVETHSDLLVRRVIRGILEEKIDNLTIKQAQLNLYFVTLRKDIDVPTSYGTSMAFHGSFLEQIKTDEHGRIANWPPGFLDEDLKESQRLLDIMYGGLSHSEGDEDA